MKLILILGLFLIGCGDSKKTYNPQIKNQVIEMIVDDGTWAVYKIKIDSVDYLVAKGIECISIIKHTK